MTELVQLEGNRDEFARRNVGIIAVSMDGLDDTRATQSENPSLVIVSDEGRSLSDAVGVVHPGAHPEGGDADAPTTLLIDERGDTRWIYRPPSVVTRLSPGELLRAIDENLR